jgi:hypothetical protein
LFDIALLGSYLNETEVDGCKALDFSSGSALLEYYPRYRLS